LLSARIVFPDGLEPSSITLKAVMAAAIRHVAHRAQYAVAVAIVLAAFAPVRA
jgi:hypothetical protein